MNQEYEYITVNDPEPGCLKAFLWVALLIALLVIVAFLMGMVGLARHW